jgi:hypothetical protein
MQAHTGKTGVEAVKKALNFGEDKAGTLSNLLLCVSAWANATCS